MSLLQAQSQATIRRIQDAARTLFLQRSYADVSMSDIAQSAALTKGALYHHFRSKESLYLEMMHADLDSKRTLFLSAIEEPGSTRDRLARLTLAYFSLPASQRDLIRLVRRDNNVFEEPLRSALVAAYQRALPEPVETVLREGIHRGEIAPTDPRLLSWQYVALVETALSPHADRVLPTAKEKVAYTLSLFLEGSIGDSNAKDS
ncbi:TetR/AcrR family transcriptional regulator [bacterium]|nr:TetR/AcrR family transcriptional regulator [bacterium]